MCPSLTSRCMHLSGMITLARPIGEVFASWSTLESAPRYAANILERTSLTDGPIALGSRYRAVDRWGPRTFSYTIEVTSLRPPTRMAVLCSDPLAGGWDAILEEVGDATELRFEATLDPAGLPGLIRPLLRPWAARQVERYLAEFKAHVEAGAAQGIRS